MPLYYKENVDILAKLKEKGYTSYKLNEEKIFGESTLTNLRHKKPVSWAVLGTVCDLLQEPIENIVEWKPKKEEV